MKLITPGRKQRGWASEYECTGKGNDGGGCGAVVLVEQDDLFKQYSSAMGEGTTYISFACMECGVITDIWRDDGLNEKNIPFPPRAIRDILPSRDTWPNLQRERPFTTPLTTS